MGNITIKLPEFMKKAKPEKAIPIPKKPKEHNEEVADLYRSSPAHFTEFLDSVVWADMKVVLEGMAFALQIQLENADDINTVKNLQGALRMVRFMQSLPDEILDEMHTQEEIDKLQEEENENAEA